MHLTMNLDQVEEIVALMAEQPISEIRFEQGESRILIRRPVTVAAAPSSSGRAEQAGRHAEAASSGAESVVADGAASTEPILLTSPMVGLFHHHREPLRYGNIVQPGQVVGNIESMKLMNEVTAGVGGRVVDVLVEDGAPVEYGQVLFHLRPDEE